MIKKLLTLIVTKRSWLIVNLCWSH